MSSFTLNLYSDYILSIKRGNGIQGKSKAKPLFVLSIIECISLGLLKQNQIRWDDSNLVNQYNALSNVYDTNISGHTPSDKYLRENLLYAKLDDELWKLLQDAENREILRHKIINNYLTNK